MVAHTRVLSLNVSTGRASAAVVAGSPYLRSVGVCAAVGATHAAFEPERVHVAPNGATVAGVG